MNDEAIVAFHKAVDQYVDIDPREAELMLAALRSEGWEVYRPDECETVTVEGCGRPTCRSHAEVVAYGLSALEGTYRLVPVPVESEEGK